MGYLAAIAEGDLADITGRYPKEVRDARIDGGTTLFLGAGLMTLFSVMGMGLIRLTFADVTADLPRCIERDV